MTKKEDAPLKKIDDKLVAEHNDLIQATANMTLNSLKLFEVAVGAVDSLGNGKNKVLIDKKQLFESLGVVGVNRNRNLTYALRRLIQDATFNMTFYDEDDEPTDITIKPIYAFQNKHNSPNIEMTFAPEILPFITELKNNFTRYRLDDVLKMKSRYAVSLYRWLMMNFRQYEYYSKSNDRTKQQLDEFLNPKIDLLEFRKLTGTQKKYKDFRNLRKRVLDASVAEINEHSEYEVSWQRIYVGRKTTGIQFHINKLSEGVRSEVTQDTEKLYKKTVNSKYTAWIIGNGILEPMTIITNKKMIINLGEKLYPKYEEFEKEFGDTVLMRHISYVAKKSGKIDNIVSYLVKSVEKYREKLKKEEKEEESRNKNKPEIPVYDWTNG